MLKTKASPEKDTVVDEAHKYPDWSKTIKNLYDDSPELNVVFTGSSLLAILDSRADLSRRALTCSKESDSFVAGKYTFEVGGRNKKMEQIRGVENSYILANDIEYGTGRRIQIWLLGSMY